MVAPCRDDLIRVIGVVQLRQRLSDRLVCPAPQVERGHARRGLERRLRCLDSTEKCRAPGLIVRDEPVHQRRGHGLGHHGLCGEARRANGLHRGGCVEGGVPRILSHQLGVGVSTEGPRRGIRDGSAAEIHQSRDTPEPVESEAQRVAARHEHGLAGIGERVGNRFGRALQRLTGKVRGERVEGVLEELEAAARGSVVEISWRQGELLAIAERRVHRRNVVLIEPRGQGGIEILFEPAHVRGDRGDVLLDAVDEQRLIGKGGVDAIKARKHSVVGRDEKGIDTIEPIVHLDLEGVDLRTNVGDLVHDLLLGRRHLRPEVAEQRKQRGDA